MPRSQTPRSSLSSAGLSFPMPETGTDEDLVPGRQGARFEVTEETTAAMHLGSSICCWSDDSFVVEHS